MKYSIPRVVVAGLKGGSGKTTLSLGLISLLKKSGKNIVPFKKGPDYIDPGWMAWAAGTPCFNLDAFLFPEEMVVRSFLHHSHGADGAVIEGNRGLFDGMDEKGTFSTAVLAKSLSAPVIIIVDCTKTTTTIAALMKGVMEFDKELQIGGVVLNQIAGSRHEGVIRNALENYTDIKVIGSMRRRRDDFIGERHLGLVPYQESVDVDDILARIAGFIGDSVNVNDVVDIMERAPSLEIKNDGALYGPNESGSERIKIGVLKDEAFQFYYPENLRMLEAMGAGIVEINALLDDKLPAIDALYIGGGFPETQAAKLSKNSVLLNDIRIKAERGLPVYAECGGLMYLGEEIEFQGKTHKMAGVLPIRCAMERRPVAHGYTIATVDEINPFYEEDLEIRGHEFHYSRVKGFEDNDEVRLVMKMKRGEGIRDGYDGMVYKNVFAAYTHVHALGSPEWAEAMIKVAREFHS